MRVVRVVETRPKSMLPAGKAAAATGAELPLNQLVSYRPAFPSVATVRVPRGQA